MKLVTLLLIALFTNNLCLATDNSMFPRMSNIRSANGTFVGREEFLNDMHNFLFDEKKSHALVISGSPGAGKTQVISRFIELHKKEYEIIWWFDINKDLNEQYREFARKWNKFVSKHYKDTSEQNFLQISLTTNNFYDIKKEVRDRLKTTKLNWLIILDNVKDNIICLKDMPIHAIHNNKSYGHIIISTQNSTYHSNVMHLDKLTREESIELLLKITGEADRKKADILAETLKDYPLAISRAASFIASYPVINIEEYNQLFLTTRAKLWENENKLRLERGEFDNYKNTVFTTLSVITNEIKKESELAYELLSISSFLDDENIPETIFHQYIKTKHQKESNDIEYNKALSILMKYSLLSPNHQIRKKKKFPANNKDKSLLFSHELIQIVIQDQLTSKEKEYYLNQAIIAANNLLPKNIYHLTDFLLQNSYLLLHIDSLLKNAKNIEVHNAATILLYLKSLEYHFIMMKHDKKTEELSSEINSLANKITDVNHLIKMRIAIMKSSFLAWVKTDYQASLKEALLAYKLMQETEEEIEFEDKLRIYTLLVKLYNLSNDDQATLHYINLGKEVIEQALNSSNKVTTDL